MYDVNRCVQDHAWYRRLPRPGGLAMTEVVVAWPHFARGAAIIDGVYRGTAIAVPYGFDLPCRDTSPDVSAISAGGRSGHPGRGVPTKQMEKIPRFRRIGGFSSKFVRPNTPSVSQRPVERAQWPNSTTGLPERIARRGIPAAKNPPIPRNRGISYQNCPSQYAERILATGREVLLDCRQARSTRHEFGSRHCRATGRAVSARLTARKTHQARACPPGHPGISRRPAAGSLRRWRSR